MCAHAQFNLILATMCKVHCYQPFDLRTVYRIWSRVDRLNTHQCPLWPFRPSVTVSSALLFSTLVFIVFLWIISCHVLLKLSKKLFDYYSRFRPNARLTIFLRCKCFLDDIMSSKSTVDMVNLVRIVSAIFSPYITCTS